MGSVEQRDLARATLDFTNEARSRDCTTSGGAYRAMDTPRHGEEKLSRFLRGGATGMNTTKLIAQWTMSGAERDVSGRFRATPDICAVIAGNKPTFEPTTTAGSFLIKGTNEEGWQTLDG